MDFSRFQKRLFATQNQNRSLRVAVVLLLIANVILAAATFSQQAIVTIQPPYMNEAVRITLNDANATYKKAWGLLVANLLGNVRPGKADFIVETLKPMLSSELFRPVIQAIQEQAKKVKENAITATFAAQEITYDSKTDTVYVFGNQVSKGPGSDPIRIPRTYELQISIRDYRPFLTSLDIYEHAPKINER